MSENIWCVEGSLPGPPIPRTMTIVRLADGRLIIHSAVALNAASINEITPSSRPQPSNANHFRGADDGNGRSSGLGWVRLGRIIENVSMYQGNAVMQQGRL